MPVLWDPKEGIHSFIILLAGVFRSPEEVRFY
jgi:hypothetical protein